MEEHFDLDIDLTPDEPEDKAEHTPADFELDIDLTLDEPEEDGHSLSLPVNLKTVGSVAPEDVRVYIHQEVYHKLEEYACSDLSHELGTILVGDYARIQGRLHVVISGCIPAKYTDASSASLTFTHETWNYVHKQLEEHWPDKRVVGWQHTHPRFGVFLSGYDLFIQENFFDLPFQVAYVIDPVAQTRGFFQWKGGKIEALNGFCVYDEVGKPVRLKRRRPARRISARERQARAARRRTVLLLVLMFLLSSACAVASFLVFGRYYQPPQAPAPAAQASQSAPDPASSAP